MMSEQEFLVGWKHILEQEEADVQRVTARWDQRKATYLAESGLSQERIAARVGKSRQWVEKRLRFGCFLTWIATSGSNSPTEARGAGIPPNLTERAFRAAWAKTASGAPGTKRLPRNQRERERFGMVAELLRIDEELPRGIATRPVHKAIVSKTVIAATLDQGWVSHDDLLERLEDDEISAEQLRDSIRNIRNQNYGGCMVEEKTVGGKAMVRIRKLPGKPTIKTARLVQFIDKALPLLKEGKELASHSMYSISPSGILRIFTLLERLLKDFQGDIDTE